MRKLLTVTRDIGLAVLAVIASMAALDGVVGIPSDTFTWQAFAQVYDQKCPNELADTDGDGIVDDNDPAVTDFNRSGCFFDRHNGSIWAGGSIAVITPADPGAYTVNHDGSDGCYHVVSHQAGELTFEPTPPPDCVLAEKLGIESLDCPDDGTAMPPSGSLTSIGNFEDPDNEGYLTSNECTEHYFTIDFPERAADACDPGNAPLYPTVIIGNNIPLVCPTGGLSTRTIGYWKNHPGEAVQYLRIVLGWNSDGSACPRTVNTATDVVNTMQGATSKDAVAMLRAQLLAAKLNVAVGDISGPDLVAVVDLIMDADELLGRNNCSPSTKARGADRAEAIYLIQALTLFNQLYGG